MVYPKASTGTGASCTLLYGDSGVGKTTEAMRFAKFVYETTGRVTRFISAEQNSSANRIRPAVEAGLIRPLWLLQNPRAVLKKLVRGEWPYPVDDQDRIVPVGQAKGYKFFPTPLEEWEEIGGYVFEATDTLAALILSDLTAKGQKINEEVVGQYTEDGESLAGAARSHYGVAQQDLLFLLNNAGPGISQASGGRVGHLLFIGHEAKSTNDITGRSVYGVGLVGSARVNDIPQSVGSVLHMELDPATGKRWVHMRSHPDSELPTVMWTAKADLPFTPEAQARLEDQWKGGRFEATAQYGLGEFLGEITELQVKEREGIVAVREEILARRAKSAPLAPSGADETNETKEKEKETDNSSAAAPSGAVETADPVPDGDGGSGAA